MPPGNEGRCGGECDTDTDFDPDTDFDTDDSRPLKKVHFCSSSRKAKILTTGIH